MKQPIPARALAFWDRQRAIGLIVDPTVERLPEKQRHIMDVMVSVDPALAWMQSVLAAAGQPYPSADDCDESEPEE